MRVDRGNILSKFLCVNLIMSAPCATVAFSYAFSPRLSRVTFSGSTLRSWSMSCFLLVSWIAMRRLYSLSAPCRAFFSDSSSSSSASSAYLSLCCSDIWQALVLPSEISSPQTLPSALSAAISSFSLLV
uniref:Uncharacterized protein n=1 Tax=Arundo donax TaxID=35708 RepID=A0A0A9AKP0_ARUDO